ncbi:MAG: CAP domain-containing protein, partial [Deltaproteobacteria bacterium]|nr:CAP domain-containing protein [Deltaproteobacteria bacterium]
MVRRFGRMNRLVVGVVLCCIFIGTFATAHAKETWNHSVLDTARGVNYLSATEKEVVFEINKLRSAPGRYADLYLIPKRGNYSGKLYKRPGQIDILTVEGVRALEECISQLKKSKAINPLLPSRGLSRAAKDHATDQAETGNVGHTGKDGSSAEMRMNRYGKWEKMAGENISYGHDLAKEIVFQMLVDDGVSSRGHRRSLMHPAFKFIGLATGSHPKYDYLCVINFAG